MLKTTVTGPSLAEVLAFTLIEPADSVARVERTASHRMAAIRGWDAWCVSHVTMSADIDGAVRTVVHCNPVGPGYREKTAFEFLTDSTARGSVRFRALVAAAGFDGVLTDERQIVGRYFATRNRGCAPSDFGPLTNALVMQ